MDMPTENYNTLIIGLLVFFVSHLAIGFHETRQVLVKFLGPRGYRGMHALFAAGGITLIVIGFGDSPVEIVWAAPAWGLMVPVIVMPFALMLMAAGHMATADIHRITRHPMLWGVVLFAAAHLLANPEKRSVMVFGSFLIYGLLAQWLTDRKRRIADPDGFAAESANTSSIPFVALAQGRAGPKEKGLGRVVIAGIVAFGALYYLHQYFAGVPLPLPF